ncbi:Rossmann fold nucleotide-binding protein Smf [Vibrio astriarenae]|nr:Rossmann fold nucleotide-binding protein Smf [Vibrio sp. C7]
MEEQELAAWLALSLTPRLRAKTFEKIVSLDAPKQWLSRSVSELQSVGFTAAQIDYLKHQSEAKVNALLQWKASNDHHNIVTQQDEAYPPLLKQVSSPPRVLFVSGRLSALSTTQIAMVGSRHATIDGLNLARQFAKQLAENQLTITSGLALGIDGYAIKVRLMLEAVLLPFLGLGWIVSTQRNIVRSQSKLSQRVLSSQNFLPTRHQNERTFLVATVLSVAYLPEY